ncbi:hypothetical protein A1351_02150 [Methylosinus sp. R-45379]|jgi:hypothetical protein|uniref:hypothetical protein n=1 Tax=unclassified Methylosinus TaxID=2624500 RepID=UPI0007C95504|nr:MULTISPECIES: hypothetical protein [unclassified Methylosinus]OAI26253.1 hypothetical protein A1351_02150 [Methylosinus sp. R-45379]
MSVPLSRALANRAGGALAERRGLFRQVLIDAAEHSDQGGAVAIFDADTGARSLSSFSLPTDERHRALVQTAGDEHTRSIRGAMLHG